MMLVLAILAILLRLLKKRNASRFPLYIALAFIWISSTPWVALLSAEKLLSNIVKEIPFKDLPKADAIVVYSWLKPFKNNSADLRRHGSQPLFNAALLYKQHQIPVLIASSFSPASPKPSIGEISFASALLQRYGVPSNDIHLISNTPGTRNSVVAISNKLHSLNSKKTILIAPELRMTRKFLSLKRLLNESDEIIYPYSNIQANQTYKSPNYAFNQWLPSADYLKITTLVLHEWYGLLVYRALGWI